MPELRDQDLTADISRTLKFNAQVTSSQQQAARERLLRSAAVQVQLEAAAPRRFHLHLAHRLHAAVRGCATLVRKGAVTVFNFLFVESDVFERARQFPSLYQHYNVHGRYAFTVIQMSA